MTTESQYIAFNPFAGDRDVHIECRTVKIVQTGKDHDCMAAYLIDRQHVINAGQLAWKESAKVEGKFGTCYCCLPCLDVLMGELIAEGNDPEFIRPI